jgi:hypothetical protein
VTEWNWLPEPRRRILEPFLATLDSETRAQVDADLERLREDPRNPPLPTWQWKGRQEPVLSDTWVSQIAERFLIRYQLFVDFPLIGIVNIIDP